MMDNRDAGGEQNEQPLGHGLGAVREARVLCVDSDGEHRRSMQHLLSDLPVSFQTVCSTEDARALLEREDFDVLLVEVRGARDDDAFALVRDTASEGRPTRTIMTTTRPTVALGVQAMRVGAIDLLRKPIDPDELLQRLAIAIEQASQIRREDRRVERLQRLCRRLNASRQAEMDRTRDDEHEDRTEIETVRPKQVGVAEEFNSLIRMELDVEALLRITLEYLLTRTGPTNAAVFLPTGHDDYSLGAYVNYDIPKETADVLLDHLADLIPQAFEYETELRRVGPDGEMARWIGDGADWLDGSEATVFSCQHEGECLAVIALFRDRRSPFEDRVINELHIMRALFTEQLARVVSIHNRHKDTEGWPGFEVDHDEGDNEHPDFGDLAA
jgi:FixJ family two-component response regulator